MNINVDLSALSVEQLKRAVQLKEQITRLEEELAALTSSQMRSAPKLMARPRPMISEAGRARIVAAQRRRWARERALKAAPQPATSTPPPAAAKRMLTTEARAKMSAASKERWARVRAEQEGKEQA